MQVHCYMLELLKHYHFHLSTARLFVVEYLRKSATVIEGPSDQQRLLVQVLMADNWMSQTDMGMEDVQGNWA